MADRIGQQLGNYRLSRLLGRGGFADVYLGEHVYLKTPAAIKLLQTKLANEQDLQAFLKEAQTIAQLVHPHIVRVLEFGLDGDVISLDEAGIQALDAGVVVIQHTSPAEDNSGI